MIKEFKYGKTMTCRSTVSFLFEYRIFHYYGNNSSRNTAIRNIMKSSSSHKKFMLLKSRLESIKDKKGIISGGKIIIDKSGNRHIWCFFYNNKGSVPIIEKETLDRYVAGGGFHQKSKTGQKTPVDILNESLCQIFPKLTQFTSEPILDSVNLSVLQFGESIGIGKNEGHYIIDKEFGEHFPMLNSLSVTPKDAEKFCEKSSGCYYLYRHDCNSVTTKKGYTNGALIRAAISIRYPIPHKSYESGNNGHCNIKAKLNLPSYSHKILKKYEYDGLVGEAGKDWWSWMFQGRFGDSHRSFEDLMMMYSGKLEDETNNITQGIMLTQNQDDKNSPTSSNIVLIREPGYQFLEKENKLGETYYTMSPNEEIFMCETPEIIDLNSPKTWGANEQKAVSLLLSAHVLNNK